MIKLDMGQFFKDAQETLVKHSPEILTGLGIAGMIATTILAVKETPKALRLLEAKKKELEVEKLTAKDTIKTAWKCYIPAAVTGTASVACIIGASSVHLSRNAALTAAYTLSETALREYREKTLETVGEKKEQLIRDAVAQDKVEKHPISSNAVIPTGIGNTRCYDPFTDRYFDSDIDKLRKAENEINSQMLDEGCVSLNDFYYQVGLGETTTGGNIGWSYNRDGFVKLNLSSCITLDGIPCIVLGFRTDPYYKYDTYY